MDLNAPDTASSASRQHYIDTGRYLTHAEVAEFAEPVAVLCPEGHQYEARGIVDEGGFTAAAGERALCPTCGAPVEGLA